jgi:putative FmdB family regulatory protein
MPTYEYACRSCDQVIEVFQSIRDDPLTVCPRCGQPGLKRLIGRGAGIIFKGSGFYETDYKRASPGKEAGGKGESTPGESGPAKPATPTPAAGSTAPAGGGAAGEKKN